jgi:hypothetical protein
MGHNLTSEIGNVGMGDIRHARTLAAELRPMRATTLIIALILMLSPVAVAHKFNHEDRHEICDIFDGPHGHFVGDGHAHTHDLAAGAALHDHDPCKQVRMKYPDWQDKAPISEIAPPTKELLPKDLLFSDGDPTNTELWIGGEAYQFPIPEGSFKVQTNFAILSDLQAAGMGLPGSGTHADPYIVEGYLIKGNMVFKDTSKCFVVRNNVIVNRVIPAPLLPDPGKIIELPPLIPIWELKNATAHQIRQEWQELKAEKDALKAQIDAEKAQWDAEKAEWEAQMAAWQAEWQQFAEDYIETVLATEQIAADFESWAEQYSPNLEQPERVHEPYIDYVNSRFTDRDAAIAAFEDYMQSVQDWVAANPPPENPPANWPGSASGWQVERANYQSYQESIASEIERYWSELMASMPDEAAYDAFVIAYNDFMDLHAEFMEQYNAFMADYNAFMVQFNAKMAETKKDIDDAKAFFAKVAKWTYEYVGQLGTYLYNTLDELVKFVLKVLQNILDPNDPNLVAQNTGQLILDWNGQCVHAYNNVINDLRVNQNNDRTGYATGGILEDNRIYTIGQIRHYDGIFRENEVGNRAHLKSLLNPSIVPAVNSVRSVNNDGANQGWYVDNVFYGQIDLDFHGHHHSAGFFAPTSHYHGSLDKVVRMYDAAGVACTTRESQVDQSKFNGPEKDYPQDDSIEVFGETVLDRTADPDECLEHFDHSKRWTSVLFSENTVIDPNGVGLRFEDRDHRADDEQANSENVRSLKRPHYHQKWVQLEDNTIVGKIFVDVLNAAGTNLWTDNWAAVQTPTGVGRTQEALSHPGAEIVNSHPYRNDAWLDINGNSIFQTQATGVLVADADDMTLFQLKDNRGYGLPSNFASGKTSAQFLQWLQEARDRTPAAVYADIKAWGGSDRGVQTFASLSNLRDAFTVQHCGNVARGLDRGLVATDRIYDDGKSIIAACGTSDWGTADPAVSITYTPMASPPPRCTEEMRQLTAETDDFYASELVFDTVDPLTVSQAATCESLPVPSEPPVVPGL